MNASDPFPLDGGCTCRAVRYRMTSRPMFVSEKEAGFPGSADTLPRANPHSVRTYRYCDPPAVVMSEEPGIVPDLLGNATVLLERTLHV